MLHSIDEISQRKCDMSGANGTVSPKEESCWGNYARGALFALLSKGHHLSQVNTQNPSVEGLCMF